MTLMSQSVVGRFDGRATESSVDPGMYVSDAGKAPNSYFIFYSINNDNRSIALGGTIS